MLSAFLKDLAHESKCLFMKILLQPVFIFQLSFSSVKALGKQVKIAERGSIGNGAEAVLGPSNLP